MLHSAGCKLGRLAACYIQLAASHAHNIFVSHLGPILLVHRQLKRMSKSKYSQVERLNSPDPLLHGQPNRRSKPSCIGFAENWQPRVRELDTTVGSRRALEAARLQKDAREYPASTILCSTL